MNHHYTPLKSFKSLGLWSTNRYEIDLLNEVLNIDFGQGATKISEVKVRGKKKYADRLGLNPGSAELADIFFNL